MAGKFSKIFVGTAIAGAAVAGGLAYFLKKKEKENSLNEDLENFDDHMNSEPEEEEEDSPISREYVTIPHSNDELSEEDALSSAELAEEEESLDDLMAEDGVDEMDEEDPDRPAAEEEKESNL